uniref:Uncharacterized protein n=1 Tax=Solanum tuberosum TaxID=4113 RepID=M1AKS9_SOLTU
MKPSNHSALISTACLAHVANWSRACPYGGYLVTEADSKALIESDKTLAESIGRVKVRLSLSQKWMHMGRFLV